MKTFLVLCAAAGLSGCTVYPAPAYDVYGNAGPAPYIVQTPPTYIYGGPGVYRWGGYQPVYPGGYDRPHPRGYDRPVPPAVVVVPSVGPLPPGPPRPGRGHGEQGRDGDRDSIPNRFDRDRDGIPDRRDPQPNIPNRRQ